MNRLFILLIGFLFLFSAGCKKETQEPDEEIPVFYFNGNVNAAPVNLQAGVNNYYMYSYYKQDSSNGLYAFYGNIRQVNCTNCINHVAFKIYDSQLSPLGGNTTFDTALSVGPYSYSWDTVLAYKRFVSFTGYSSPGDTVQSYFWDFGDGTTSTMQNPVHAYIMGNFTACLRVTYTSGCQGYSCNTVIPGISNTDDCAVTIIDSALSGNIVKLKAVTLTANPNTYNWNFNDTASGNNNFSTLQNVNHDFSSPGIYRVNVQISNIGCTALVYKNIATPNFTAGCYSNYKFTVLANQFPFSKIVISWIDATGTVYSSEHVSQPTDSYFEVLSVDEYMLNENKERTKKIHARFKCMLSNGKSTIPVTDADAIFAVSFR